jgi:hypothetical protein
MDDRQVMLERLPRGEPLTAERIGADDDFVVHVRGHPDYV